MKLSNITDVQKFTAAVNACTGDVYLKSVEGDVFNLKSSLSQYIAIGRLLEESGYGNHPAVLRFFSRLADRLLEDSLPGSEGGGSLPPLEERMYAGWSSQRS